MEVHGNLDLMENKLVNSGFGADADFPEVPTPGRILFLHNVLYFCAEINGGLPVWVPMTQQISMKQFSINTPALEWTIEHALNIAAPLVQVYDTAGKWIIPDEIDCSSNNQVVVKFSTPTAGMAIVMRGQVDGGSPPSISYEAEFTNQSTVVINHGLGYNPIINVYIDNNLVQPQSVVHNSTIQATITFSSPQTGSIRCI